MTRRFGSRKEAEDYARELAMDAATAQSIFNQFKRQRLLEDRSEYEVDDLLDAGYGLSQQEAQKLYQMLQQWRNSGEDAPPAGKRVLDHPVLWKRFGGGYEIWEGGGPNHTDWMIKAPGGWMNLGTQAKAVEYVEKQLKG